MPVEQSRGGLLTRCALHCPAARQEGDPWSLSSLSFYGLTWMRANSQLSLSYFTGLLGYPLVQHILEIHLRYNQVCLSPEQSRAGMTVE